MPLCASVHFLLQRSEYGAARPKPFWPSREQAEVQFLPGGLLNPSGWGDRVLLTFGLRSFNLGSRGSSGLWSAFKRATWRTCRLLKRKVKRTVAFFRTYSARGRICGGNGRIRDEGFQVWPVQNLCFNQVEPCNLKLSRVKDRSRRAGIVICQW